MVGLIIMDGFGIAPNVPSNAIYMQGTPCLDELKKNASVSTLQASGLNVGLPDGQMGNSEVGHLNIGAGRVVYQDLTQISKEINEGTFFKNDELLAAMNNAKKGKSLHIMGLLGTGGVHSYFDHLKALIDMAKKEKVKDVFVHCFLDGRDTPPTSGEKFLAELQEYLDRVGVGKIASICGRFYMMDRDNRWERVEKGYNLLTQGEGIQENDPITAIRNSYKNNVTDEFVLPTAICQNGKPIAKIEKGDSVIFFNYRPDRAREISRALAESDFNFFERKGGFLNPLYVGFTRYDATFKNVRIAFKPRNLVNTLGEYLAKNNKKQFRIAETEKYAHVTFFFNGGVETPNEGEDRILIPSPKVTTYDLKPEMSAYEVAEKAVEAIESKKYDVMILNFANCDMVGHTGIFDAAKLAVKAVDECTKKVTDAITKQGGSVLITADHGNADYMFTDDGEPFTAHTTNPVPLILVNGNRGLKDGKLCDIAPTMLELLGMEIPKEMTGQSLLV